MPNAFHLAVDRDQSKQVFGCREPADLAAVIERLAAELQGSPARLDSGAGWERLDRTLSHESLSEGPDGYPLSHVFLGGRPLDADPEATVRLIRPDTAAHLAAALSELDEQAVRQRWQDLPDGGAGDEAEFDPQWANLQQLADFFSEAARQRQAVVFVAH